MIGSQKGGTAKTTTTLNLAYCLQKMGKKVLAVDFDSQANLTTCFGVEDTGVNTIYYNLPVVQYSPKASAGVAYWKSAKVLISYEG